ncbi:MAG: SagB/ThcOx family dehydrogenase [Bacteroidales bacterium]
MEKIKLPTPGTHETITLNKAFKKRISCRNYKDKPINLSELGDLLWAADGISDKSFKPRRTAPSAGATYPLELYIATREKSVYELDPGIYHYNPESHILTKHLHGNIIDKLPQATFDQSFITNASIAILVASHNKRTTKLYGERGIQYIWMEAGGVCQNIHLKVIEMNLGTVIIGAFEDKKMKEIFKLEGEEPLALMPVGHPVEQSIYQ